MSKGYKVLNAGFIRETLRIAAPNPSLSFGDIVIDSRKVRKGSLFIALTDGRRDGHDFIDDAIAQGAAGVLCAKNRSIGKKSVPLLECDDTMEALVDLARAWRAQFAIPIVAVVGSVGKTSTKEVLAAALANDSAKVLKTLGNENGDIGLPLTLLRLRSHHEIAVIEIGIDAPGAMEKHMALAMPTAAICTAISPEHMQNFLDLKTVAREELMCLDTVVEHGGIVAVNCDDPFIRPLMFSFPPGRAYGFSLDEHSENRERGVLYGRFQVPQTLCIGVHHQEEKRIFIPLPGAHHARNTLGAIALGLGLGRGLDSMISGIESAEMPSGRCEIHKLSSNITIICDYYNAAPASIVAGMETVVLLSKSDGRRIACLADMLELGEEEEKFHRDLAATLRELAFSAVLTFGQRMRWLCDELKTQNFLGHLIHCESHDSMTQELDRLLKVGDTVLLKGSRSMKMEVVWNELKSRRSDDTRA